MSDEFARQRTSSGLKTGDNVGNFKTIQMQSAQQTLPKQLHGQRLEAALQQIPIMSYPDSRPAIQADASASCRIQIGGKDLIIRMLAEVFHINQSNDGQVRWQQVSTSLVPVSLYSRTTSKWLDYMLTASSMVAANDPAAAMSPDSHEFLLLMKQFHKSQQQAMAARVDANDGSHNFAQQPNKHGQVHYNDRAMDLSDRHQKGHIVFQIIGHDFIDGQCKKILNVKLVQPGTRLGRASDYFVYWKERPTQSACNLDRTKHFHHLQQQFSSSFASNSSYPQHTQSASASAQKGRWLVVGTNEGDWQTWGLNFASINDAKLFYDICSLNIVDLDFNSEYLKQLATSDAARHQSRISNLRIPPTLNQTMISPMSLGSNPSQRRQVKSHTESGMRKIGRAHV